MASFNPNGKTEKGSNTYLPFSDQNLCYPRTLSLGMGRLVPFMLEPVFPNQVFETHPEFLLRALPFASQVYQRYNVDIHYFYCPTGLLWPNFYLAQSGGFDGQTEFVTPYFDWIYHARRAMYKHSIFDYLDISLPDANLDPEIPISMGNFNLSVLPLMAYVKIFLDYFASPHFEYGQRLQELVMSRGSLFLNDGDNDKDLFNIFYGLNLGEGDPNAAWQEYTELGSAVSTVFQLPFAHFDWDYFTSAMPEQQHGPLMAIPLDSEGNIKVESLIQGTGGSPEDGDYVISELNLFGKVENGVLHIEAQNSPFNTPESINGGIQQLPDGSVRPFVGDFKVVVDDNKALVNDLRTAMLITEYFESLGNVDFRPENWLLSQFHQKSADQRLNKSQSIGYQRFYVNIGEVFSNNVSAGEEFEGAAVPGVGTSTAKGYGVGKTRTFHVPEPGYIYGLVHVHPEAKYSQGIPRHFRWLDRFDYPNPKFAHLNYQEVYNWELGFSGKVSDKEAFGYQPRYSELRTRVGRVNGDFRLKTNVNTSSRLFDVRPKLNEHFLQVRPNENHLDRVFNALGGYQQNAQFSLDIVNHTYTRIPFPKVGLPRI